MADSKKLTADAGAISSPHPLISKQGLAAGASPTGLTELAGYLGPVGADGSCRLYLDLSFRQYVEIPNAATQIVDVTTAGPDDPDGPSRVYVIAKTRVSVDVSTVAEALCGVAGGTITGEHLAQALEGDEDDPGSAFLGPTVKGCHFVGAKQVNFTPIGIYITTPRRCTRLPFRL